MYQSPINAPSHVANKSDGKVEIAHPEAKYSVTQNCGAPVFCCAKAGSCGYISHNGVKFNLLQFHIHSYSESAVDGVVTVLEAHFVHSHVHNNGDTKILVLGLFLNTSAESNPGLDRFRTALSAGKGEYTVDSAADLYGSSTTSGSRVFEFLGRV